MAATYKDFYREPSKPHQCMHHSEKDGTRCRASAMHNHFMCYHHHDDDIPTVIQNDPFLIDSLAGLSDIQKALTDVAARLACNHIDLKRASLLIQVLQVASANLRTRPADPPPAPPTADSQPRTADSKNLTTAPPAEPPAAPATERPQATPPPRLRGWRVPRTAPTATQPKRNHQQPTPPSTQPNNQQPATRNRLPRSERNRRRRTTTDHLPLSPPRTLNREPRTY